MRTKNHLRSMKRTEFIHSLAGVALAIPAFGQTPAQEKPAPLPAELVKTFVGAGHGNIAKIKELYAEHPTLIYAAHDWGGGDFETALESAGHVGNVEIAEFLISKGARLNLFCLTMLGKTEQVKYLLEAFPTFLTALGPHGFTLLHHAKVGGERSKELYDYLSSKGLKDTQKKFL